MSRFDWDNEYHVRHGIRDSERQRRCREDDDRHQPRGDAGRPRSLGRRRGHRPRDGEPRGLPRLRDRDADAPRGAGGRGRLRGGRLPSAGRHRRVAERDRHRGVRQVRPRELTGGRRIAPRRVRLRPAGHGRRRQLRHPRAAGAGRRRPVGGDARRCLGPGHRQDRRAGRARRDDGPGRGPDPAQPTGTSPRF